MKHMGDNGRRLFFSCAAVALVLAAMTIVNVMLDHKLKLDSETMSGDTEYKYHIAMIGDNPTDEFWLSIYEGAKKEGETKDTYVENFGADLTTDYDVEARMKMAIAAKVDGIVVEAVQGDEMKDLIDKAKEAQIPVMTILSDAPNSSRISFVSGNDYALGEIYGNQIIEDVNTRTQENQEETPIKVAILVDSRDENASPSLIYSGISETVAEVSDHIELSTVLIDSSGEFEAEETIRNLVLSKDHPDILVALSTTDTIGAYQNVIDYNMVGKITLIGYYASQDILEMVQKGIIKSTVAINADEMGQTAADGMYEYITKQYISEYLPVEAKLIDSENVAQYINKDE